MAPDGVGMKKGGVSIRQVLKKGPWTAAEDAILMEYVRKHGEGNWNAVQRNSGLMRCGKSCRLRWANHLRPNLKKGAFTLDEERLIVELHAKMGNKWARMAAQLPGRTDNEIKNYWNTRLKRRQRAGLPMYPQDMQLPQTQQTSFNISPPSLSLLDIFNPSTMKPATITQQFTTPPCFTNTTNNNNPLKIFCDPRGGLSLTLASSPIKNSQFSSIVPNNLSQCLSNSIPLPQPLQQNYPSFSIPTTRPLLGISSNMNELILGMGNSSMAKTTATSSENTSSDFVMTTSSTDDANNSGLSRGHSTGLLEDLLEESQALTTRAEKIEPESAYRFAHGGDTPNKNSQGSSTSLNSSSGMLTKGASLEGINQVDDDIMSLLDNFPLGVPVPNWYDERDELNVQSSTAITNNDNGGAENLSEDCKSPVVTTAEHSHRNHNWEIGGCSWDNMPSFCFN